MTNKAWAKTANPIPILSCVPRSCCGIYCLTDVKTEQKYIGASIDIWRRILHHKLMVDRKGKHYWRTDVSLKDLTVEILERTPNLRSREIFWIQEYLNMGFDLINRNLSSGYNRISQ